MNKTELLAFISGVVTVFVTLIICATWHSYHTTQAMKSNIESAIVKGIDPISVRCAYGSAQDTLCVAYAVTHQKDSQPRK